MPGTFDFLSEALPTVGAGIKLGFGIRELFRDVEEPPALAAQIAAAEQARSFAAAAADPSSPQFQALAGLNEQQRREELVGGIRRILQFNQRALARGGRGFFVSPERRDEAVSAALTRNFERARVEANINARNYLLNAAQAAGAVAGQFGQIAQTEQGLIDRERLRRTSRYDALGTGISALGAQIGDLAKVFGGQTGQQNGGGFRFPGATGAPQPISPVQQGGVRQRGLGGLY